MNIFEKLISSIGHFFSGIFVKAKPFLEKEIPLAIEVVNGFKKAVDLVETSPIKQVFDAAIGPVGASLVAQAQAALPKVLTDLGIAKGVLDQSTTEDTLMAAIKAVAQIDPSARNMYYSGIATTVLTDITGGKLTWAEAEIVINKAYQDGINLHIFNAQIPDPAAKKDPVQNPPVVTAPGGPQFPTDTTN